MSQKQPNPWPPEGGERKPPAPPPVPPKRSGTVRVEVGGLGILREAIDAQRDRIPAIIDKALRDAMNSPPPMTEARARGIIAECTEWRAFHSGGTVALDGSFTADQLEALAWWLRNKPGEPL